MRDRTLAARRARTLSTLLFAAALAAAGFRSPAGAAEETSENDGGAALAAEAYKRGDFTAAAQGYEALRSRAPRSASLLYNLGNAYFKSGDLGRAVANFERALVLAPRDAELRENLLIAREQCEDRPSAGARGAITRAREAAKTLTPDEWAGILVAGYLVVLAASLGPYYAPGRPKLTRRLATAGILLLVLGGLGLREWGDALGPGRRATVVVPEASIRSGPGDTYLGEFSLHPGSLVRVEARRGDWVKVTYSSSLRGWTEASGLEFL